MWVLKVEYLKDRVLSSLILTFDNRILHAGYLYFMVVLKNSFSVKTNPCVLRIGYGNLDLRVCLHILVNILGIVCAEPELSVFLKTEHERAAFRLSIASYSCQILYRVCL